MEGNISSEKYKTDSLPKRRVSTKVVQRIVKFQIWESLRICFASFNMRPYESKSFERHLL